MLNIVARQAEIIPQPTQVISGININASTQESPPIDRQEVHIQNADAYWAHASTDSQKRLADAPLQEMPTNQPYPVTSKDVTEQPLRERPTIFADQVPASVAESFGWVRVPRAKPLNPEFIQNAPVPGYTEKELAYNLAAHLAA